jgi:hypothetical protein
MIFRRDDLSRPARLSFRRARKESQGRWNDREPSFAPEGRDQC